MDLETARAYMIEQKELEQKIASTEPEVDTPEETKTPAERLQSLGERIDALPSTSDNGIDNHVNVSFGMDAPSLKLRTQHTVYMDGSRRPRELFAVEAKWIYGRVASPISESKGLLAWEYLGLGGIDENPETLRKLTLLEQSVRAAEEALAPTPIDTSVS